MIRKFFENSFCKTMFGDQENVNCFLMKCENCEDFYFLSTIKMAPCLKCNQLIPAVVVANPYVIDVKKIKELLKFKSQQNPKFESRDTAGRWEDVS